MKLKISFFLLLMCGCLFPFGTATTLQPTTLTTDADSTLATTSLQPSTTQGFTVICPGNQNVTVEIGVSGAVVNWTEPIVPDPMRMVLVSQTHHPGDFLPIGQTDVIYIYQDTVTFEVQFCSFQVIVEAVDNIPPTLQCDDTTESAPGGSGGMSVIFSEPIVTDNSGTVIVLFQSASPGDFFMTGTTEVTYIYADPSGNTGQCVFNVIVTEVDTTPPEVVNCPSTVSETVELGEPGASITWMEPSAVDISQVAQTSTHNRGDFFLIGETTVTYVFTDSSSNSATCTFTVMVGTVNVMMCPSSMSFFTCNSSIAVSWTTPVVNTIPESNLTITSSHSPGDTFTIGESEIVYNFTDQFGRTIQCIFRVSIERDLENCSRAFNTVYKIVVITSSIFFVAFLFIIFVVVSICIKKCKQNEGVADTNEVVDLGTTFHLYYNTQEYVRSIATPDSLYISNNQHERVTQN
ncbi:Hyalin [Holothuria leucospilota]|uniref:Hyalin n=1 Tax=Holothuria leucospilota TaxID=206669 RepID=A0A9Q1C503_HOLLE|nr:Hyalin [Holothuria leucospilota]